jgi:hypothetical protein
MLKSQDLEDDVSTFTIIRFNGDDSDNESDSKEQGHAKLSKSSKGQPTAHLRRRDQQIILCRMKR